ncbi:hypothetical protein ELF58_24180 [Salmonella enterica]|nr:hypothetical protein [Salmonella enterica]
MNARSPGSTPGRCKLLNPGAALQPIAGQRPQEVHAIPVGAGLPAMGRKAAPLFLGDHCA